MSVVLYANMRIYQYADIVVRFYAYIPIWQYTNMVLCQYADIVVRFADRSCVVTIYHKAGP